MTAHYIKAADYRDYNGRLCPYVVAIKWGSKRLSITGVEGPLANGNCRGGCGQVHEKAEHINREPFYARLMKIWERWHLNDLCAGSPAQEMWLRDHPVTAAYPESHYEKASDALTAAGLNPDPNAGGYEYGSAWLHEDVPQDVIDWLFALPVYDGLPSCWAN